VRRRKAVPAASTLDAILDVELPHLTRDITLQRGEAEIPLRVRAITDAQFQRLRHVPAREQSYELVSMALVSPHVPDDHLSRFPLPHEAGQIADIVMEISGYSDAAADPIGAGA
jgi:hypothetical protein